MPFKKISGKNYTYIFPCLWLALHLLFIRADPAINFDFSRGPFTDEGFYLAQLRNYLHGHGWGILKADALLKSPLFAVLFYWPFRVIGISLVKARFVFLLFSLVPLVIIAREKNWKLFVFFFLIIGITQGYVFEYAHYVMPEFLCCNVILLALFYLYRYLHQRKVFPLIIAALLFSSAYYLKSQFVYILPLPFLLLMLFTSKALFTGQFKKVIPHFLLFTSIITLPLLAYYFLWYYPHKSFYDYLFLAENSKRIETPAHMWQTVKFYYEEVFLVPEMKFHTIVFWTSLVAALPVLLFTKRKEVRFLLAASLIWVMLELHKLVILYIPLRYLVPLLYAALMITATTLAGYANLFLNRRNLPVIRGSIAAVVVVASLFLIHERWHYLSKMYADRKYSLLEANLYLARHLHSNAPVVGNWSPSLTWLVRNENLPVTHWVINDEKIFTSIFPAVIVAEDKETDSDGAYCKKGIQLQEVCDSARTFEIGKWKVLIWWVNQEKAKKLSTKLKGEL